MHIKDLLFGKVKFTACDGFTEIFLSECKRSGIQLYSASVKDGILSAYVRQYDVSALFSCASASGMTISINSRTGLPDIFIRYRKRLGVPAGLLTFILVVAVLRSFIWSVDVSGTNKIPEEYIYEHLSSLEVKRGSFCHTVNCKDVEFSLYKNFSDISWVAVKVIGARVFVDISEVKVSQKYKDNSYCNIIASKDGEIVRADIFSGEGILYPGTAVVKGDLLVSGVKNHRDGSVEFTAADACILARTRNFISSTVPVTITADRAYQCKDIYLPTFFGLSVEGVIDVKNNYFTKTGSYFRSGDVVYPVGIIRLHIAELQEEQISLTEEQALLIAFRDFSLSTASLQETAEIISSQFSVSFSDKCELSAVFVCEEDIAYKKSFTVEEN